jgi:Zn-dependent protease
MNRKKICDITSSLFSLILGILPVVFWSCLIYSFDEAMGASITILAMLIHEFGHLTCIFIFTGKWKVPKGRFNGLCISDTGCKSYREQIMNYAAGITFNLIAAALAMIFSKSKNEYTELFVTINMATAISNLLPIDGYDGYKLIISVIDYLELGFRAYAFFEIVSFAFTSSMCVFSLFLVYSFGNGYWFMAIFLFATVNKLQKWQKHKNSRI